MDSNNKIIENSNNNNNQIVDMNNVDQLVRIYKKNNNIKNTITNIFNTIYLKNKGFFYKNFIRDSGLKRSIVMNKIYLHIYLNMKLDANYNLYYYNRSYKFNEDDVILYLTYAQIYATFIGYNSDILDFRSRPVYDRDLLFLLKNKDRI